MVSLYPPVPYAYGSRRPVLRPNLDALFEVVGTTLIVRLVTDHIRTIGVRITIPLQRGEPQEVHASSPERPGYLRVHLDRQRGRYQVKVEGEFLFLLFSFCALFRNLFHGPFCPSSLSAHPRTRHAISQSTGFPTCPLSSLGARPKQPTTTTGNATIPESFPPIPTPFHVPQNRFRPAVTWC